MQSWKNICKQCVELMFPPSQLKNKYILMDKPKLKGLFYVCYFSALRRTYPLHL